eukprot:365807-Chlamydomonas_euryale.AAC.4
MTTTTTTSITALGSLDSFSFSSSSRRSSSHCWLWTSWTQHRPRPPLRKVPPPLRPQVDPPLCFMYDRKYVACNCQALPATRPHAHTCLAVITHWTLAHTSRDLWQGHTGGKGGQAQAWIYNRY